MIKDFFYFSKSNWGKERGQVTNVTPDCDLLHRGIIRPQVILSRVKVYAEGPEGIATRHGYAKSWKSVRV